MTVPKTVGVFATRLAGTDGVSLESAKIATDLRRRGHRVVHCAGALDAALEGLVVPAMHFDHPIALDEVTRAFGDPDDAADQDRTLITEIEAHADALRPELAGFVDDFGVDVAIVQNAFAIPMHLSLARALTTFLIDRSLPTLAHHHDFRWERDRFSPTRVPGLLDACFPPRAPNISHAVISSFARRELRGRTGIDAVVIPNVFDFATPPPGLDDYNADFREAIGLDADDLLVLQPTRVVPRKRIELAIELVARLERSDAKLVIPHEAGDEGWEYLDELRALADARGVDLRYVADRVSATRGRSPDGSKTYALWDVYPHADFVTYPSVLEGFGNALVETMYFRLPALVNRYPVYDADIRPLGVRFVECDDVITDRVVEQVEQLLASPAERRLVGAHNFAIAAEHFSYETLDRLLVRSLPTLAT